MVLMMMVVVMLMMVTLMMMMVVTGDGGLAQLDVNIKGQVCGGLFQVY